MSFGTPPRPLPGTYLQTPAPNRFQGFVPQNPSASPAVLQRSSRQLDQDVDAQRRQIQQVRPALPPSGTESSDPKARAGRAIDYVLKYEVDHPDLDSYVGQGVSNQYDTSNDSSWDPFQTVKMYTIPDEIYNQYNHAQVSTSMGLFPDLDLVWVTIDNALYIWDYTGQSTADLQGIENQRSCISAVHLTVPRKGVFLPSIQYLLVVATLTEIVLYGVSNEADATGKKKPQFHRTNMSVSTKNLSINVITSSRKTGRIFFAGRTDLDVYEMTYEAEERWFYNRCRKINHVSGLYDKAQIWKSTSDRHVTGMCVDDSRSLVYALSNDSSIRVFHMRDNGGLEQVIRKDLVSTFTDIGNRAAGNIMSESLNTTTGIISISPISAQEASKLHLVAVTTTGYRLYFSATTSYGFVVNESSQAPRSLQVQHVKLPPRLQSTDPIHLAPNQGPTDSPQAIRTLAVSRLASRIAPGYFFCFAHDPKHSITDTLFISAVDSGRTGRTPQVPQMLVSRFFENEMFLNVSGTAEDVGMRTPAYNATEKPPGFGNEPAIQFDKPAPEVAILTNAGVQIVRRRRHVDIFAGFARQGSGEEGRAGQVRAFINRYGRRETIATALAVACGQGLEVSPDFRTSRMADASVVNFARDVFLKEGGRATLNENLAESQPNPIDAVRPSPRHFGLVLYLSRLIRSIWIGVIVKEEPDVMGVVKIVPSVPLEKLKKVQRDLKSLQEFLHANRNSIDGLSGPEILSRAATQLEELSYQGEHRDMKAAVQFIDSTIEGISFILVLFEERVEDIVGLLSAESKPLFKSWTFRDLFTQQKGKDLAKEVVKAIVNRNIAKGTNVDTIADSLRRKCGSFCSPDDVIIFKAQDFIKRASDPGTKPDDSRSLLNDSLTLFKKVAQSLTFDYLTTAVDKYVSLEFYAGAIELCLAVAQHTDKENLALSWINEGVIPRVDSFGYKTDTTGRNDDIRKIHYEFRKQCYDLIHSVILSLEGIVQSQLTPPSVLDKRRREAYGVINSSDDEVFLTNLYDWYLSQGWQSRILETDNGFVDTYLNRKAQDDLVHADLLAQYYVIRKRFYDAANIQFGISQSSFILSLSERIKRLSEAKTNISTKAPSNSGPRSWQDVKQRISDMLDLAIIQGEILERLKNDPRLPPATRTDVLAKVDGQIMSIQELFAQYADHAGYWDICLFIFHVSDIRNTMAIQSTWMHLIESTHTEAIAQGIGQPYEMVAAKVRDVGLKIQLSESVFPVPVILTLLERYKFEEQRGMGPATWVVDLFLDLNVPFESIYQGLEAMFYSDEAPFSGSNRRVIGNDLVYLISRWFTATSRGGGPVFGNDSAAGTVSGLLQILQQHGVDEKWANEARVYRARIEQLLR